MYNNSQKNNDSINKSALTLSFFVHIILLLFLFWNIQWKNKSESLQTIEVELYNEIPGNAATTKKTKQVNKAIEIDMMRIDPGAIGFIRGFSQEHKYSTVGEQITVEQLTELGIVMRISRHDHVYRHHVCNK